MPHRRYLVEKTRWRRTRRVFALILLAVLTIFGVLNLPKEQVLARQTPVIQPLFLTSQTNKADSKASLLAIQAQELYQAYEFAEAAKLWEQAAVAYAQVGDAKGVTTSQINMAEALQAMGFHPRACSTLLQAFKVDDIDCRNLSSGSNESKQQQDSLIKTLEQLPNSQIKAIGLRGLGDIFQKLDDLELSQ